MKCENCGKYEARVRDYRTIDGITGKVLHCKWCANLNDVALYRIRVEGIDPVSFYDTIDYEKLDIEELEELRDVTYNKLVDELGDEELLENLLEYERYLILREEQPHK
jgi:hypothetical protein